MAKFDRDKDLGDAASRIFNESCTNLECAVCLQTCIHPAELPCGHIFCYLCIKGIVNQGRRCAMCRQDIPADYLEKPRLLKPVDGETSNQGFEDGHLWFYEGHNGWWQYDERTSLELESAYQKGERCCELLIAGFLYMADFDAMLQYRRNDPWKRRRIKRDLATTNKKGVAGLKAMQNFCSSSPNIPQFVSNEPSDNNPISAQSHTSVINNLISLRSLSLSDSGPSHSGEENNETNRNGLRMRNRNLSASCSSFNHPVQTNTNSEIHLENLDSIPTRNFDLDRIIHDTLDWTIEQIESLNLELVNDYEILFRDVSNYDNLVNNTSRGRSDNAASYYRSSFVNSGHNSGFQSRSDSFNNSAESFSVLNSNENDTPNETQNIPHSHFSSHNDAPFRNQLDESEQRIAPQPPRMRVRGLRSRVTAPRRSASLSRETLF